MGDEFNKVIVWRGKDGSVRITTLTRKRPGETDEDRIKRAVDANRKNRAFYKNAKYFVKDPSELVSIVASHPKGHPERIRVNDKGVMTIDSDVKTIKEKAYEKGAVKKSKLVALGFTEEEAEEMI